MTLAAQLPRRRLSAILVFLAVGFGALFIVPFHVPVHPAISDSYAFGFSNRAALLLFVAFAALFAYWSGGLSLIAKQPEEAADVKPMSRRLLYVTLAITAAITLCTWLAFRGFGAFNEAIYQFDRLQQLAAGGVPFRGFEYIYGPTILYFPYLLHRLLHLPLLDAYFLSWTIEWLAGVYLLWLTISWVSATTSRRDGLYLLTFLSFIFATAAMGTNYTPLRFIGAPFFAALSLRTLQSRPSALWGVLVAIAGAAWVLFYSPEQGIAFIAGTLAFYLIFLKRHHQVGWGSIALLVAGSALVLLFAARVGIFANMRAMAEGGFNLPVLPSIGILTMLGLLLVSACILVNSFRLNRTGGPLEYLILIAFCALPAAFGRCDFGHVFMNALGAFIASWTVLSYHRLGGRWMFWGYVIGAVGLPVGLYQSNNIVTMPLKYTLLSPSNPHPAIRAFTLHAMNRALGPAVTQVKLEKWSRALPVVDRRWNVPAGQPLFAPLGYPSNIKFNASLPTIEEGRYFGLANVMQSYQVQQKIDELRSRPSQLLLFTADVRCGNPAAGPTASELAAADAETRRQLRLNLQSFFTPRVRNHGDFTSPFCAYITAHYAPAPYIAPFIGAEIWRRTAADTRP